jgi:hypothetical protein
MASSVLAGAFGAGSLDAPGDFDLSFAGIPSFAGIM